MNILTKLKNSQGFLILKKLWIFMQIQNKNKTFSANNRINFFPHSHSLTRTQLEFFLRRQLITVFWDVVCTKKNKKIFSSTQTVSLLWRRLFAFSIFLSSSSYHLFFLLFFSRPIFVFYFLAVTTWSRFKCVCWPLATVCHFHFTRHCLVDLTKNSFKGYAPLSQIPKSWHFSLFFGNPRRQTNKKLTKKSQRIGFLTWAFLMRFCHFCSMITMCFIIIFVF